MKDIILAVDIGNTHAHFGLVIEDVVTEHWSVPTSSLNDSLSDWSWTNRLQSRSFAGCCYCSVAPSVNDMFELRLGKIVDKIHHLNCNNLRGISISYPKPSEIGQDRLANSVAAIARFGAPAIVIDMGTAVTFDIISAEGKYQGGIIAPGMNLMTRYLNEKTELLPLLPPIPVKQLKSMIGKSTKEAMQVGCTFGYSGMIESMLYKLIEEMKSMQCVDQISVVLTGGDAQYLSESILDKYDYDPNLTLSGLAIEWQLQ